MAVDPTAHAPTTYGRKADVRTALRALRVSESHIQTALERIGVTREPVAEVMRDFGFLSAEGVARLTATLEGWDYLSPLELEAKVDAEAVAPHRTGWRDDDTFVPICMEGASLVVALPGPKAFNATQQSFRGVRTRYIGASPATIKRIFRRYYSNTDYVFRRAVAAYQDSRRKSEEGDESVGAARTFIRALLKHSVYAGASDIYMHNSELVGVIKLKVDGISQVVASINPELLEQIIRILFTDASIRREDVDKEKFKEGTVEDDKSKELSELLRDYQFRLEIGSSRAGLTAQIRVLERSNEAMDFDNLNLTANVSRRIRTWAHSSAGMVLVTGPTGSGKTTTLYAMMRLIDPVATSVQTIENPVEYRHGLWMQYEAARHQEEAVELNRILKGMLRNAPDVVLIGELRDADTAKTALRAANTGHLVFATLHTNTAPAVISQLKKFDVDTEAAASEILGIVSQRLVRLLCRHCRTPDATGARRALFPDPAATVFRAHPAGCAYCGHRGYAGRAVIAEMLNFHEPEVRAAVESGGTSTQLQKHLFDKKNLFDAAKELVERGATSIDEAFRVVPPIYLPANLTLGEA